MIKEWKVQPILDKDECPYRYYPKNILGCKYGDAKGYQGNECKHDICPIKLGIIDLEKLKRQIEKADEILETLQALYRSETGIKHKWFK